MNSKDLTNLASYFLDCEKTEAHIDITHFNFLSFLDFENISPKNVLELAWISSSYLKATENFTDLRDGILFIFSKINWFRKHSFEFEQYVDICLDYVKKNSISSFEGRFYFTKILFEDVYFDIKEGEWYSVLEDLEDDCPEYDFTLWNMEKK